MSDDPQTQTTNLLSWVREWSRPALLIVVLSLFASAVTAWATLGNQVCNNRDDIGEIKTAIKEALPREVAEARFRSIDGDLDEIKQLLRDNRTR